MPILLDVLVECLLEPVGVGHDVEEEAAGASDAGDDCVDGLKDIRSTDEPARTYLHDEHGDVGPCDLAEVRVDGQREYEDAGNSGVGAVRVGDLTDRSNDAQNRQDERACLNETVQTRNNGLRP